jgi:Malectin domain/Chitobiase/beta-hexosaminidase C-terminal domain/Fn3 associated
MFQSERAGDCPPKILVLKQGHSDRHFFKAMLFCALLLFLVPSVVAQTNVVTQHYDNSRTGANTNETILTPSNVNSSLFGKLFSRNVDGYVYAQPLYMVGVTMGAGTSQPGTKHNVLFIATEHDSVYAFDADSDLGANATPLWKVTLLDAAHGAAANATPVPSGDLATEDMVPEIGITGTPVIDPTTNTIYVVGKIKESPTYVQRLHALDITTGAEKFGGPATLAASVPGIGTGSSGGTLGWDSLWEFQRPGLLLLNGIIYIGFGAHQDLGPWHGWILAYSATTLQQTGAWCASPNQQASGIWMSGAGLAGNVPDPTNHPYGQMFTVTGNGAYDATPPYNNTMDFGDSIIKLDLTNGAPTMISNGTTGGDAFTPHDQAALNNGDLDQASGGLLLLPDAVGGGQHLLTQVGKTGRVYVLNQGNLGGYNPNNTTDPQQQATVAGMWSMPAYWNGNLYFWGSGDFLKAFSFGNGVISANPTSTSVEQFNFPGATPTVSANGATRGIVWDIRTDAFSSQGREILYAHDASNVANLLYSSDQNVARDNPGNAVKFAVPTVSNGKVYVGAEYQLSVYGLLNGLTQAATPVISPGSETFNPTQPVQVTITDSTSGVQIYYTTDGSTPTTASAVYAGPIMVSTTETIQAIAEGTGFLESAVATATYTALSQVATPVITPSTGTYTATQAVTITDTTPGATIYYTLDGSQPTTSSTKYSGWFPASATTRVKAIATAPNFTVSATATSNLTIQNAGAGVFLVHAGGGNYTDLLGQVWSADNSFTGGTTGAITSPIQNTSDPALYQTERYGAFSYNFTVPNGNYTVLLKFAEIYWTKAGQRAFNVSINSTPVLTNFDIIVAAGAPLTALDKSFPVTVTNGTITVQFTTGSANWPKVSAVEIQGAGVGVQINPTTVNLSASQTQQFTPTVTGATNTNVIWSLSPSVGTLSNAGLYTAPSSITSNQAVNVTATSVADTSKSATATVNLQTSVPAAMPTFSLPGGTYLGAQTVSISDTTPGSTIFYTLDGSVPATSVGGSTQQYSSALTVSSTETINAVAVASGYTTSAIANATYTITPPAATPVITPGTGTYSATQTVTITDGTSGAAIYYTLDGSPPTTSSTKYLGSFSVNASTTVKAIATAANFSASAIATSIITIQGSSGAGLFLVHAGGGQYTDTLGQVWSADNSFTGGWTGSTASSIQNTSDPALYQSERYGAFSYNFTVPNGNYTVLLKFAETYWTQAGQRVFNVSINGTPVLTNFDIIVAAGAPLTAVDKSFPVTVSNGTITVQFTTGSANWPKVSAIEIQGANVGVQINPTSVNLSASQTQQFTPTVTGTTNTNVTWSLTPGVGTVSSSGLYTAPSSITSNQTVNVTATSVADTSKSATATVNLQTFPPAATPVITPGTGTYSATQTVTITDGTSGAAIYYTLDGSPPTTSSTKYLGSFSVNASTTVKAIATAANFSASAIATSIITIQGSSGAGLFLVHAGGGQYTDTLGQVWSADNSFTGGWTGSTASSIQNTSDPALYQSERYGAFSYNFTVPNGNYTVLLKFAETYWTQAGQRVFNVSINGTPVLTNFDIIVAAGAPLTAVDKSFPVAVTNGTITVQFITGSANWPKVSAVKVH